MKVQVNSVLTVLLHKILGLHLGNELYFIFAFVPLFCNSVNLCKISTFSINYIYFLIGKTLTLQHNMNS